MRRREGGIFQETTVCPAVGATFDTHCFSEVGAPINEIFDVVKVQCGTFCLVYNSDWYWVMRVDTLGYGLDQFRVIVT